MHPNLYKKAIDKVIKKKTSRQTTIYLHNKSTCIPPTEENARSVIISQRGGFIRTVKEYLTVQILYKNVICNFCILPFQITTGYFPKSDIFYEILGKYMLKTRDNSPNLIFLTRFGKLCIF